MIIDLYIEVDESIKQKNIYYILRLLRHLLDNVIRIYKYKKLIYIL